MRIYFILVAFTN